VPGILTSNNNKSPKQFNQSDKITKEDHSLYSIAIPIPLYTHTSRIDIERRERRGSYIVSKHAAVQNAKPLFFFSNFCAVDIFYTYICQPPFIQRAFHPKHAQSEKK
jgi:hypothetical protein